MVFDGFVTHWIAIVPVKAFTAAKSRLETDSALDRALVAQAMALDSLAAAVGTPEITSILVVQDNHTGFPAGDWQVIAGADRGLNAAITCGVRHVAEHEAPGYGIFVMMADLPCLDPEALSSIVHSAEHFPVSLVSDASGVGTTMLLARDGGLLPDAIRPQFGHHSCAAHVTQGAVNLSTIDNAPRRALNRARRDVDTSVDLWDALRIGAGQHTRALF